MLQCVAVCACAEHGQMATSLVVKGRDKFAHVGYRVLQRGAVCCSVVQCVAVCCSVLQCVDAECCSVCLRKPLTNGQVSCCQKPAHVGHSML